MTKIITPNFEFAQKKAIELLKSSSFEIFPIDLLTLIKELDLKIICTTFSEFEKRYGDRFENVLDLLQSDDGVTWYNAKNNQYIIIYNDKVDYYPHLRFTIAHELGHIVLGHFQKAEYSFLMFSSEEKYGILEKEAGYFARNLLFPIPLLQAVVFKTKGPLSIEMVSNLFNVSRKVVKRTEKHLEKLSYVKSDVELCAHFEKGINQMVMINNVITKKHPFN